MEHAGYKRGFPFDDDVMHGKSKLKDHLEDLARRHPELADQLKDWTDIEKSPKIPRGSGSSEQGQSEPKAHPKPPEDAGQGPSRPQQNLRNTVPDMQAQEKLDQLRNARSQSAPPEGPPGKGSTPMPQVNSQTPPSDQRGDQQPSQNHQPQNQQSQQSQSNQQPPQPHVRGNERYIPIFVEGRGEIIVNVPAEKDSGAHAQTPPPRQKKSFKEPQGSTVNQQQPQGQVPTSPSPSPAPSAAPSQESAHQSQQQQQQQQAPPPAQPPRPPSPLTLVATIQKEVEDLKQRVDTFKGSKTDKEYIYLDEMLTRNLLKLDNIESEGRDEVRAARKEVIKLIQQCITTLENLKTTP